MPALIDWYRDPGHRTDLPALYGRGELGCDPMSLFRTVQGLVIHQGTYERSGLPLGPDQLADDDVGAGQVLEQALRLDPGPLAAPRPLSRKVVGQCFHSAVLYCALLRNHGVPARARCGFASYLRTGKWIDHWVTERWDGELWVCEDADADRLELGPDAFCPAGRAWLACRRGEDEPTSFGIAGVWGWPELRGSLLSDAAALVKNEQFTWGGWELAVQPSVPDADEDAWLDHLAELTLDDERIPELREVITANPTFSRVRPSHGAVPENQPER